MLLNSEKTILVCCSVRKHFIAWVIYSEKSAVCMIYSSLLYKILLNISLKFKLNIDTMHSDFAFYAVLIHNVSSSKAVKINLYFFAFI